MRAGGRECPVPAATAVSRRETIPARIRPGRASRPGGRRTARDSRAIRPRPAARVPGPALVLLPPPAPAVAALVMAPPQAAAQGRVMTRARALRRDTAPAPAVAA